MAQKQEKIETVELTREEVSIEDLQKRIAELEMQLSEAKSSGTTGRKEQVLAVLKEHGHITVQKIAKLVGISDKNVSSQLTALRKAGHAIGTDSRGFKFLENPVLAESTPAETPESKE